MSNSMAFKNGILQNDFKCVKPPVLKTLKMFFFNDPKNGNFNTP